MADTSNDISSTEYSDHPFTSQERIEDYDWSDFELCTAEKSTIKPYADPKILAYSYWVMGLSQQDIADRYGVTQPAVGYQMQRLDIPRARHHTNSDAIVGYYQHKYARVCSTCDGERDKVGVHQLLACLNNDPHEVFDDRTEVHHASGHPLDNRPETIELVTIEEHHWLHDGNDSGWVVEDGEPRLRRDPDEDRCDPVEEWWRPVGDEGTDER